MLIDTHAHLTGDTLFADVDGVVERALQGNVKKIINICTDVKTLARASALSQKYPFIYHAAAIHPHDVDKQGATDFATIAQAAYEKRLVAIGETGLDYHYAFSSAQMQKSCLKQYEELARELQLPLIIHCREAFSDLFELLTYEKVVLHCFTGTQEEAERALERNWHISFSGIITFKKSEDLKRIASTIPFNRLLIETDAPFLAPMPHRGKKNESSFLPFTAEEVAKARNISLQELEKKLEENVFNLFQI